MKTRDLALFIFLAFLISWGIIGLYLFLPDFMNSVFGPLTGEHPLFYLATYAPALAAIILVVARAGFDGVRRLLSRLLLWRCSVGWLALLVVGLPAVFIVGAWISSGSLVLALPFPSLSAYLLALVLMGIKGPVEEIGWRGLALPLLQRVMTPLNAALVLGLIWGVWHFPAFLLSGTPQSAWSFTPFLVGAVAISVIVGALFNASRGSILLPALFHWQLINPLWPDAQPYDSYLLVVIAVAVTWHYRSIMTSRSGGITEVIPGRAGDA